MLMITRIAGRACWIALLLTAWHLGLAQAPATPSALKTRNVVLIVSDGLRWQEIFTGADPVLLNEQHGGIWAKPADLKRQFWRDDVQARRKALFPFLWSTVAARGQIFGNQDEGQRRPRDQLSGFSYPGLQRDDDSGHAGSADQFQRVRPEPERLGVRVAERSAGVRRQGRRCSPPG